MKTLKTKTKKSVRKIKVEIFNCGGNSGVWKYRRIEGRKYLTLERMNSNYDTDCIIKNIPLEWVEGMSSAQIYNKYFNCHGMEA
jgi:hypothetical protein